MQRRIYPAPLASEGRIWILMVRSPIAALSMLVGAGIFSMDSRFDSPWHGLPDTSPPSASTSMWTMLHEGSWMGSILIFTRQPPTHLGFPRGRSNIYTQGNSLILALTSHPKTVRASFQSFASSANHSIRPGDPTAALILLLRLRLPNPTAL